MNEFIHTFSAVTYLTKSQIHSMAAAYDCERDCNNNEIWFYNHTEKKLVFSKYADRGFRMETDFTPLAEKRYQKEHKEYKAKWIVTPAKLIYQGQPMMKLYAPDEYAEACCITAVERSDAAERFTEEVYQEPVREEKSKV